MNSEQKTHDEEVMVRYLLGELGEEERRQFEESCFADDHHFEELLAVEAELTDDYVRGDLVGLRRERFERQLLNTAEGRDDVEFARVITATRAPAPQVVSVVDRDRSNWRHPFAWLGLRGPAFQLSLAALTLVLVGLGLWLIWSSLQTRIGGDQTVRDGQPSNVKPQTPDQSASPAPSPGEQQAAATPERPQQRNGPNGNLSPSHAAPAILSLVVVPGFDRYSGGANDLMITPQTRTVRLQLALEGENYRSYRAVLSSVEGRVILERRGLKARANKSGRTVLLELPARDFPEGDFILTLSGTTTQGEFEDVHKYFLSTSKVNLQGR